MKTLILGLGNLLLCDEGVGVHVARTLMNAGNLEGAVVLDVGTAILDAMPAIEEAERIIVVDAVKADGPPGTVYRMPLDAFVPAQSIASMHGFDITRVLALANRSDFPEIIVYGVEPARIEWSVDLSPEVAEAVPYVIDAIKLELLNH